MHTRSGVNALAKDGDASLVERVLAGDEMAMERLVR
jgi:hypothetical protein